MSKKERITTFEIQKKLGISRDRLKGWIPEYIKPSVEVTTGPGTPNLLSKFDVCRLLVFKHLIERGYKRESAAERIRMFRHAEFTMKSSEINLVAFVHREGGKYLDPKYKKGWAFPDVIYGKDMKEIFYDLQRFNILKNKSEDVVIVNFKKIREAVDAAFK